MDGQRFDDFARLFASGLTRRRLFKSIAVGLAAAIPDLGKSVSATGESCAQDTDCPFSPLNICCGGICIKGGCCPSDGFFDNPRCQGGDFVCVDSYCEPFVCGVHGPCDPGLFCCNGVCQNIECCPGDDSYCESGYVCGSDGFCTLATCNGDGDCGSSICCYGYCRQSECCNESLNDGHCASGYECQQDGYCYPALCNSDGECPGGICCSGSCIEGAECCGDDPFDGHCAYPDYSCVGSDTGYGVCVKLKCGSDDDCGSGSICCQDGSCYSGECCSFDSSPNPHCPSGYTCFEGTCDEPSCFADSDCSDGICCNGGCYSGECCGTDPNDKHCSAGTVCFEGVCDKKQECVADGDCDAGYECKSGTCDKKPVAEPSKTPAKPTDKWELWTGDEATLLGATVYLRRLTEDDEEGEYGDGVVGPDYGKQDFERLAKYGANYVDISHPATYAEKAPYKPDKAVEKSLTDLVKLAEEADLYVVISLRTGPGRGETTPEGFPICRAGGCFSGGSDDDGLLLLSSKLWDDEEAQDAWVALWGATARAYAKDPYVIGYHLMAMPDAPDTRSYLDLLAKIVAAIRKEDKETPILVSAPGSGLPDDLKGVKPLDDERIVYRVDTFTPSRYLKQEADSDDALEYGDEFDPDEDPEEGDFDAAWLKAMLKPAVEWSADNRKPVAIGGYGMPRWQPELKSYLEDLLELFEKGSWRTGLWLWHPEDGPVDDDAFNLEYGDDRDEHEATENDLLDLIVDYWKANKVRPSTGT